MSGTQQRRWHIYPSRDALVERAALIIARIADAAIAQHGEFNIVLAGGETPRAIYARLAELDAQWSHWQAFFGDERVAPADHADRNSTMALDAWLSRCSEVRVHPIMTELGAERAATDYTRVIDAVRLDLVLLGLGEDAHTASLFDMNAHDIHDDVIEVDNAPKPPRERVSLTPRCLSRGENVLFLVTGAAKREAVARWRAGEMLPAALIRPVNGVDILIDSGAYGVG